MPPSTQSSAPAPLNTDGLIPLVVGITGHRDLRPQDEPALKESIRQLLREKRSQYPETPIILLSPLGEGADRLTASIALEQGAQLYVPLPMPLEPYKADFADDRSRAEFDALLAKATAVYPLRILEGEGGSTVGDLMNSPEARAHQYALLGAYLVQHSHILIALWNGDDDLKDELTGGTAQVVRFRLHGVPAPYGPAVSVLEDSGRGAVHYIHTPRQSDGEIGGTPAELKILQPSGATVNDEDNLARLNIFNRDVLAHDSTLRDSTKQNIGFLLGKDAVSTGLIPEEGKSASGAAYPLAVFGWADTLATKYAGMMNKTIKRIFVMVFIAALFFNLFHSLPHGSHGSDHGDGGGHATEAHAADNHDAGHGPATTAKAGTHDAHSASGEGHGAAGHSTPAAKHGGVDSHAAGDSHGTPAAGKSGDAHAPKDTHSAKAPAGKDSYATDDGHGATDSHGTPASGGSHGTASTESSGFNLNIVSLPWYLWLYLALVVFNVFLHRWAVQQEFQNKYQDYRALAEGLRVQIFWRLAGLRDRANEHYLGKQRGELAWIQHAIRGYNVLADGREAGQNQTEAAHLAFVTHQWVQEQRHYYIHKVEREEENLEKTEKTIERCLMVSIGMAAILAILSLPVSANIPVIRDVRHFSELPLPHSLIMIAIVMFAVTAGLVHGYNQHFARSEHIKRFSRMSVLFDTAARELNDLVKNGELTKAKGLIRDLGKEALSENGDWVLLHRERPLEVPHAG